MSDDFKKKVAISGGLAIAMLLLILGAAYVHGVAAEAASYKSLLDAERTKTEIFKDEAGRWHARTLAAEARPAEILAVYGKEMEGLKDQVKGLKNNLSNLKTYIATKIETSGEVTTILKDTVYVNQFGDSVQRKTFSYADEWLNMSGSILKDTIKVRYKMSDSIQFITYYEKRKFLDVIRKPKLLFEKKDLIVEAISHNPNTKIPLLKSISTTPPRIKRFGVSAFAGYDPFGKQPVLAVGVSYDLFQF